MSPKDLCVKLVQADTETEVIATLRDAGLWDGKEHWRDYGEKENNFADIGNQQALPESALVEKIINSVDAVLMRECLRRGIRPDGVDAPTTMTDAVKEFFKIPGGKLSHLDPKQRTKLAENIRLIATGTVKSPCYAIADLGEGQHPADFADTFLSLGKSNKLRIHFVQGKFNMGGTGVLLFCGHRNLQLIVSRRDPEIGNVPESDCKWGFTVVRKDPPPDSARHSVFRYLAPAGNILSFSSKTLDILPGKFPEAHGQPMAHGTYIKLYEYNMSGLKTNLTLDPYNRLSALLPSLALPVRLCERRKHYEAHSAETTLNGLSVRLEEDKRENTEAGFPCGGELVVEGEKIQVRLVAFKKGAGKSYVKDEGILFVVNGQTQGHLPKAFFRREAVGLGYIADSLLVLADCSNASPETREHLFMSSRDRLRKGEFRATLERKLEQFLHSHQGLRELKDRRRREEMENRLSDSKPLANLLNSIFEKSPTLSKLFLKGERLSNPTKPEPTGIKEEYVGKRFPTFFKLASEFPEAKPKVVHLGHRFQVQYKTDADNDYTQRDDDRGEFELLCEGSLVDCELNFWNGTATLNVELPHEAQTGQILHFASILTDITRVEPFQETFCVQVAEETPKVPGPKGQRKPPDSNEAGNKGKTLGKLAMPNIIEVRLDKWAEHEFTAKSSLEVKGSREDGFDFYVNMDNIHLQTEIKSRKQGQPQLLEAKYKYGMVLLGLGLLETQDLPIAEEEDSSLDRLGLIRWCADGFSPLLVPMVEELGGLEIGEE
jgi:hypothetical protein